MTPEALLLAKELKAAHLAARAAAADLRACETSLATAQKALADAKAKADSLKARLLVELGAPDSAKGEGY